MTRLFKLTADDVAYWVSAETSEEAVLIVRNDENAADPHFCPEFVVPMSRATAELEEVTQLNGDARVTDLWELFTADQSPRVVACSEWA